MPLSEEDKQAIDRALQAWRQGDVSLDAALEFSHLADLSRPHSPASVQAAGDLEKDGEAIEAGATPVLDEVRGVVMLSQTCDVVRGCCARPFVEVAPLVEVAGPVVEEIRRLKRPAFAYVPTTAAERLVADLDRTMTVEKALVAGWTIAELDGYVAALIVSPEMIPPSEWLPGSGAENTNSGMSPRPRPRLPR